MNVSDRTILIISVLLAVMIAVGAGVATHNAVGNYDRQTAALERIADALEEKDVPTDSAEWADTGIHVRDLNALIGLEYMAQPGYVIADTGRVGGEFWYTLKRDPTAPDAD